MIYRPGLNQISFKCIECGAIYSDVYFFIEIGTRKKKNCRRINREREGEREREREREKERE